jgi:taurine dioxygenase
VDFQDELSEAVVDEVRLVLANHCVVSFGPQDVTPEQFETVAKRFGKVYVPTITGGAMAPGTEGVAVLDAEAVGVTHRRTGGDWHVDELWTDDPNELAMLHPVQLPPTGGGTAFTSMYAAYDNLSLPMKDFIEPLRAEYSASISVKNYTLAAQRTMDPERRLRCEAAAQRAAAIGPVLHNLVKVHPITGRKYLCYTHHVIERIEGLSQPESHMLSEFLYSHVGSPDFMYYHPWELGDVAMWDERLCQHAGMPSGPPRVMWRCYIKESPYASGAK